MKTVMITTSPVRNKNAPALDRSTFLNQEDRDKLQVAYYDDFAVLVGGDSVEVLHEECDFNDFDQVIFRHSISNRIMGNALGHVASRQGMRLNVSSAAVLDPVENKIAQALLLAGELESLKLPKTLYLQSWSEASRQLVLDNFKYPFVVKSNAGIRGERNFLVESAEDLDQAVAELSCDILCQEYIVNDGDYRILYVGLENKPLVFKRESDESVYLNNTTQGAKARLSVDLPQRVIDEAKEVARKLGYEITGIDIIWSSESDTAYFIEANATPVLLSGAFKDRKVEMISKYINGSEA